jgi:hypothetical protein
MKTPVYASTGVSLQRGIIAFFIFAALLLLLVYFAEPAIYAQSLALTSSPSDRYPLPVTLFLVAILTFLTVLTVGVLRRWRWLFWLLLVAFAASVIQIPVLLLTILDVVPSPNPLWYSLLRLAAAMYELALAVGMISIYRHQGAWALGKNGKAKA